MRSAVGGYRPSIPIPIPIPMLQRRRRRPPASKHCVRVKPRSRRRWRPAGQSRTPYLNELRPPSPSRSGGPPASGRGGALESQPPPPGTVQFNALLIHAPGDTDLRWLSYVRGHAAGAQDDIDRRTYKL
ncbi:hypothetical protein L227DRAFT_53562 [Lentinus tigrinus ALCF2SS1-6]|uniref:Uncharacterized protein n=1 Tax=Lentinus tigrinus ALCF2SS1-6 TaxID=1328759 RepID=A0A5C2SCM8_9APHY|nr:hypothetical protein L227DRAFT_53562 [Lentinus tigrinus ALCF2SS1-6]